MPTVSRQRITSRISGRFVAKLGFFQATKRLLIISGLLSLLLSCSHETEKSNNLWNEPSFAEFGSLITRIETEVSKCVILRGFEYLPSLDSKKVGRDETLSGIMSLFAFDETHESYGIVASLVAAKSLKDPNQDYVSSLDDPTRADFYAAASKCREEAEKRNTSSYYSPKLEIIRVRAKDRFKVDPDVVRLSRIWSLCMRKKGFQRSNPWETRETLRKRAYDQTGSAAALTIFLAEERGIAQADWACFAPLRDDYQKSANRLQGD